MRMDQEMEVFRHAPAVWLDIPCSSDERQWLDYLSSEGDPIGSSYYGIRGDIPDLVLLRISRESDGVYVEEQVDHQSCGITDEDLRNAVRNDRLFAEHHGTSRISGDIAPSWIFWHINLSVFSSKGNPPSKGYLCPFQAYT
jgi:hypothetical protein